MRIYIVGFMATGKSGVGERLADALGWPFLDLDVEVVRRTHRSITEIFDRFGELTFRRLELEALFDTAKLECVVVATGGGTFASPAGHTWIARHGRSIWLDLPFAVLAERATGEARETRPLFADSAAVERLYRRRRPAYRRADVRLVLSGGESLEEIARRLVPDLARLLPR